MISAICLDLSASRRRSTAPPARTTARRKVRAASVGMTDLNCASAAIAGLNAAISGAREAWRLVAQSATEIVFGRAYRLRGIPLGGRIDKAGVALYFAEGFHPILLRARFA
jgi:hypothetical protein